MSNRPPKINPTGTSYRRVRVWRVPNEYSWRAHVTAKGQQYGNHGKAWRAMMKVVDEYIKADANIEYREYVEDGITYCDVKCTPPLLEMMG